MLLESMLAKKVVRVVPTSSKQTYAPNNARSNFAAGVSASNILLFGGISGTSGNNGGVQYPANFLREPVGSSSAVSTATPNTYTWCSGACVVGSDLYFADGHTGAYQNWFRKLGIDSGSLVSLAATLGQTRHSSVLVNINNTKIARCFGYGSNGVLQGDMSIYDIASNTWATKTSSPYPADGVNGGWHYNGKIYYPFGWSDALARNMDFIQVYDIASDSWSTVAKKPDAQFFPGCSWGQSCIVDGVIWMFVSALKINGVQINGLGLIKYHIDAGVYEYFSTPYTNRNCYALAVQPVTNDIYLVGGVAAAPGAANYEALARINEILVFGTK